MSTLARILLGVSLVVLALGLGSAGPASAISFSLLTYENADGADVNGLDLWFDVTESAGGVEFKFYNSSTIASTIANIYFEASGVGQDLGASSIVGESAGVDFRDGGSPSNPAPGGLDWAGTLARFRAHNPAPAKGINNPGAVSGQQEWLTIRFDLGSASYSDLIADLEDGDFRVAQHVISMPQSIWTVSGSPTDPVPLPATVWLLGSGLAGWLGARRISRRSR